jgi:hypothetical protein
MFRCSIHCAAKLNATPLLSKSSNRSYFNFVHKQNICLNSWLLYNNRENCCSCVCVCVCVCVCEWKTLICMSPLLIGRRSHFLTCCYSQSYAQHLHSYLGLHCIKQLNKAKRTEPNRTTLCWQLCRFWAKMSIFLKLMKEGVEDLTMISNPSNAEITRQLGSRYMRQLIYTNIGDVLISVLLAVLFTTWNA